MTDRIAGERELIETYLAPLAAGMPGAFGLRDDAAILTHPAGTDLVVSNDPVIAGVHFFANDRADDIAWKALAVNVSDLVAKGAKPVAYTMALALPEPPTRSWMADFVSGLEQAQQAFQCRLIGGDTDLTPGPLSIGITAFGVVEHAKMIPRDGAKAGDHVFVTGTIGDAALGLLLHDSSSVRRTGITDGAKSSLVGRYLRPNPRIQLIDALREHARAALDVSDGLVKDLGRLVGNAGLELRVSNVPLSTAARAVLAADPKLLETILTGGCDYEVLFSVAPDETSNMRQAAAAAGVKVTDLGVLSSAARGVSVIGADGTEVSLPRCGYDHFSKL